MLSVIIPASNEAAHIAPCLMALFASDPVPGGTEVLVVANGCKDTTAEIARAQHPQAKAHGWRLQVIDRAQGSKPGALNAGDNAASGTIRAYLDADVRVSPPLMAALVAALSRETAAYASGTPHIPRPKSTITRAYARFWQTLPFAQSPAPGYGLFAVNAAGRSRWGRFPDIISDDTFVRLQFAPNERIACPAPYDWPMVEGFAALVRVRRRQDAGVAEIIRTYPAIMAREGKARLGASGLFQRALHDPTGFAVYAAVSAAVHFGRGADGWTRGR